jgi:flagellar biosynthetic protein FliR
MHTEVSIDFAILYSFLVVLARVSGFLVLVPLPGMSAGPTVARIVLAVTLTLSLMSAWPTVKTATESGDLVLWAASEFALGLVAGVGVALLLEAFQVAAQSIGLQAGFSYASTVDPSTQADTAVLQTVLQLFSGVLFFTMGLDLHVFRLLTIGLNGVPGSGAFSKAFSVEAVLRFGSMMFGNALRMALPVMGFLLLLDLAFALVSKVHAQMQLLSFSFSAKMLAGMALFAAAFALCPSILSAAAARTLEILLHLLS